jgi:hypothetical protein
MIKKYSLFWIVAMIYGVLFLVMSSALSPAHADVESVWLTSGEWSRHTDEGIHHYRQNNTGVGLQVDLDADSSLVMGWYNNSVHRETVYLGGTYTPWHFGGAKLGGLYVMATGYDRYVPAVPMVGIFGSYEYEHAGINMMWLPGVVAAVQLKWRIK